MDQLGIVASPARGYPNKIALFQSSFAPENVLSRDKFGGPVPRQPAAHYPHSRLNVMVTYGISPSELLFFCIQNY